MKRKNLKYETEEAEMLQKEAPKLSSLEKSNTFYVKTDYFDKLSIEIIAKIHLTEKKPKFMNLPDGIFRLRYVVPVAATLIIILITLFFFEKPASVQQLTLIGYSVDDVLAESPEIIENMDESLLIETLFADNSVNGYFDDDFLNSTILTNDEIDDYLSQESLTPEIFIDY